MRSMVVTAPNAGAVKPLSIKGFDKIKADFGLKDVQLEHGKDSIMTLYFKNGGIIKIEDFFNGDNKIIEFKDDGIVTQYNVDKVILEQEYFILSGKLEPLSSVATSGGEAINIKGNVVAINTEGGTMPSSGGGYPLDEIVYEGVGGVGSLGALDEYVPEENGLGTTAYTRFVSEIRNSTGGITGGGTGGGVVPPPPPPVTGSMSIVMQEKEWASIENPSSPSGGGQNGLLFSNITIGMPSVQSARIDFQGGILGSKWYIGNIQIVTGGAHEIYNKNGVVLYAEYVKNSDGTGSLIITSLNGGPIDSNIMSSILGSIHHYDGVVGKEYSVQELFAQDTFHTGVIGGTVSVTGSDGHSTSQNVHVEFRKYIDVASEPNFADGHVAKNSYYVKGTEGNNLLDISFTGTNSSNIILGGGGKDTIYGGNGKDVIIGDGSGSLSDVHIGETAKDSDDVLIGNNGKDTILGGGGNDLIYGGDTNQIDTGSNVLIGGSGNDTIYAGDKGDLIIGGSREDTVSNTGNDLLIGGSGSDSLYGSGGNDTIIGGNGTGSKGDHILGGNGNNVIFGGAIVMPSDGKYENITIVDDTENDTISTGAGNDYIVTGGGSDKIHSGLGNDTIIVNGESQSTVVAKGGDNSIHITNNTGSVYTGDGKDTIVINGGNNLVVSGDGDDSITANMTTGILDSGAGSDILSISNSHDLVLLLREGSNTLLGENISGGLWADNGNNVITVGKSSIDIGLGSGNNSVTFEESTGSLTAGNGNNSVISNNSNGSIVTGSGDNTIVLDGGVVKVDVAGGNNSISIVSGNMDIVSREGNDTIIVSGGKSTISSGSGDDSIEIRADGQVVDTDRGDDYVLVKSEWNTIDTGDGADTITISSNNNIITTGCGNDSVIITGDRNSVDMIEDNNIVTIDGSNNSIVAGFGNDTIIIKSGISGSNSSNNVQTGYGEDSVVVNSGGNSINVGADNDTVVLNAGNNTVNLGTGADKVLGSLGNDSIIATGDRIGDIIDLGGGDDFVAIQDGADSTIHGGSGRDTVEIQGHGGDIDRFDVDIKDVEVLRFSNVKEVELGGKSFSDMITGNSVKHLEIENTSGADISIILESSDGGRWSSTLESNVYTYSVGGKEYSITFGKGFTITLDSPHSIESGMAVEGVLVGEIVGVVLGAEEKDGTDKVASEDSISVIGMHEVRESMRMDDLLFEEDEDVVSIVSLENIRTDTGDNVSMGEDTDAVLDIGSPVYSCENPLSRIEIEAQLNNTML